MPRDSNKPRTKFVSFQGKSGFTFLDTPDTFFTPEGKWSQQIYLNQESYDRLMELKNEGLRNTIKKNDDGYYVTFSRPCQKAFMGKWKAFEPPMIEDKDGKPLPRSTRIGHGSDITVTVEAYYTRPRPTAEYNVNARLATVRVDHLIPFSREDYDIKQERAAKATDKMPSQATDGTW